MPDDGLAHPQQHAGSPDAAAFQGQYQQLYAPHSNAFSSQLEMPVSSRQGPYDMSAMANTLPQPGFRPSYNVGQQQHQRYAPSGPSMVPQMVQYPGQPHMSQLAGQQYYIQHQPIPQYYAAQMPATTQQHQAGLQMPRAGMHMGYYPNSAIMNQSQGPAPAPAYFYPASNHYPAQNPPMNNSLAQSQYFVADGSSRPQASSPLYKDIDGGSLSGFVPNEGMAQSWQLVTPHQS